MSLDEDLKELEEFNRVTGKDYSYGQWKAKTENKNKPMPMSVNNMRILPGRMFRWTEEREAQLKKLVRKDLKRRVIAEILGCSLTTVNRRINQMIEDGEI